MHFGGVDYGLATIPTGGVPPPLVAQILTRTLCQPAVREARAQDRAFYDSMIENLRLASNDYEALVSAWRILLRLLEDVNITVGDIQHPQRQMEPYVFLGMEFDHRAVTVRVSDKLRTKLAKADEWSAEVRSSAATFKRSSASASGQAWWWTTRCTARTTSSSS